MLPRLRLSAKVSLTVWCYLLYTKNLSQGKLGESVDHWALGIAIFKICIGAIPFQNPYSVSVSDIWA